MSADDEDDDLPPSLVSDEDRAFRAASRKLVDWVRVEPSHLFLRAFLPSLLFVPAGGTLVALGMSARLFHGPINLLWIVLGLLSTACGPLWALFSLIRAMREDTYVAIRLDGLAVRLDPRAPEVLYAWESIADARAEPLPKAVLVTLVSGQIVRLSGPFSITSELEFAARIRDARRLALWHRLSAATLAVHAHDRQ